MNFYPGKPRSLSKESYIADLARQANKKHPAEDQHKWHVISTLHFLQWQFGILCFNPIDRTETAWALNDRKKFSNSVPKLIPYTVPPSPCLPVGERVDRGSQLYPLRLWRRGNYPFYPTQATCLEKLPGIAQGCCLRRIAPYHKAIKRITKMLEQIA